MSARTVTERKENRTLREKGAFCRVCYFRLEDIPNVIYTIDLTTLYIENYCKSNRYMLYYN